jgi:hypothetical protein
MNRSLPHKVEKVARSARGAVRPPILPHKVGKVARSVGWGRPIASYRSEQF